MNAWLSRLTPRQHGLVLVVCAVILVAVNLMVVRLGRYYPAVFPAAGLVLPMGLFMLITGYGRDEMAERRVTPIMVLVVVASLGGLGAGLYANSVVFGQPWG